MTDPWETVSEQTAYECDGFTVRNQTVRLPDDTEAEFDYITEEPSTVVLPFTADGAVVTIEEWRQAVERTNHGLPAGTLHEGEQPAEGARRELREETGYRAESMEHLVTLEPANGFADSVFHYFVAEGCEPAGDQNLDSDETITTRTVAYETLIDALRAGDIRDGRTANGLLYYELFERSE
ncbi:NUDIX hydrolase [Halovenus marina]|uniref:NUDIX hydrolase n=1 Tax=Halovenus marina TaxID=3396621 RepID=UPI003F57FC00